MAFLEPRIATFFTILTVSFALLPAPPGKDESNTTVKTSSFLGTETCPGNISFEGYGTVHLVNAYWNVPNDLAGKVNVVNNTVVAGLKGRTYFADGCAVGSYTPSDYIALKLLGKRLRYMSDLSNAGCGCNAAVYLTSLHQNNAVSGCHDYYCDANSICGVKCAEIDIQEANNKAFGATLHVEDDKYGVGKGYGGGGSNWNGHRDWNQWEYGPEGACINTRRPYQVSAEFPVDGRGILKAMTIILSQEGSICELKASIRNYRHHGKDSMSELTSALAAGMTPILSYWNSTDMLWLDGKGQDGQGPCDAKDEGLNCGESVRFYDFVVEDL
eukprot:TRINITY_DN98401_c0_g1_i1.p1 TRINITY_DN98401_c0_g1~~TRINITY_DN98401_c0_g1_i1.p1  ORF type:complete len:358 (+),score=54.02 TRINITY_DN98401_c0_g1_i1:90-1076(+)